MQYSSSNPQEYLASLDEDWRKKTLLEIRKLILDQNLSEIIEYKMLGYQDKGKTIFHLNAQKNYVSLYVGDKRKIDVSGDLLAGLDAGKGCIRFKNKQDIGTSRIGEFVKQAVDLSRSGEDIGC